MCMLFYIFNQSNTVLKSTKTHLQFWCLVKYICKCQNCTLKCSVFAAAPGQIDFHAYWSTCWPRGGRSSSWKSCIMTPAAHEGKYHWWNCFHVSASTHFTRRWRTWTWITRSSSASVRCRSRRTFLSFPPRCVTLLRWRKSRTSRRLWPTNKTRYTFCPVFNSL